MKIARPYVLDVLEDSIVAEQPITTRAITDCKAWMLNLTRSIVCILKDFGGSKKVESKNCCCPREGFVVNRWKYAR